VAFDPHIKVEGLKELQADIKQRQGKLPTEIGQIHKEVGQFIIGKLPEGDPHAVGMGSGATVRPSATKRDVVLRVGGAHREGKDYMQWGKAAVMPPVSGRPYIVGAIEDNQEQIEEMFMKKYMDVLGPAFFKASRG